MIVAHLVIKYAKQKLPKRMVTNIYCNTGGRIRVWSLSVTAHIHTVIIYDRGWGTNLEAGFFVSNTVCISLLRIRKLDNLLLGNVIIVCCFSPFWVVHTYIP